MAWPQADKKSASDEDSTCATEQTPVREESG